MQHSFKTVFHFSGELFSTKPLHLCPTNSNLIIVYYFPCTLKCWSYNLFSNHRSGGKKPVLFLQQLSFPEQEDQRHIIISFILEGSEAQKEYFTEIGTAQVFFLMSLERVKSEVYFVFPSAVCLPAKSLQLCPTLQSYGQQPARFLCPWDSPGRNTGEGCHALLQIFPTQ